MTLSDLARFLAENHLLLHVIRLKPSQVWTAVLEPNGFVTSADRDRFEASSRDPADAVEKATAKFETWLQGRPRE